MISKLLCYFFGHRRGKRIGVTATGTNSSFMEFRCPRCTATWARKARKPKTV